MYIYIGSNWTPSNGRGDNAVDLQKIAGWTDLFLCGFKTGAIYIDSNFFACVDLPQFCPV